MSFTGLKERLLTMDYFKDFKFAYFSFTLAVRLKQIDFIYKNIRTTRSSFIFI